MAVGLKTRSRLALLLAPALLAGCASFDGLPKPTISTTTARKIVEKYPIDTALESYYQIKAPADQKAYRDRIIGIYMTAIDSEFMEFRRHLSRQAKSSNFVLDLGVLGLSGGASFAGQRTANILSAGAAGLTGTRGSISKQLFFEQALPAMLGNIDAQRTTVRTQIIQRMQQSADQYPLPVALSDLTRYEEAASLDKAVQTAAADAGDHQKAADGKLAFEVDRMAGVPTKAEVDDRLALRAMLRDASLDLAGANAIATAVGVPTGADLDTVLLAIRDKLNAEQDSAERKKIIAKIDLAIKSLPAKPAS